MRQHTPNTDRARSRRTQLATALESLPDLDRLVLSLYLLEGLSVLEIAGALKLTTREVEQLRVAALATIAKGLGKDVNGRRAA
jgi:DNA-directed RNA polymerase specialized sigma24 family protein